MDSPTWRRINEILADALELAPEERSDFVRKACEGDASLCAQVEIYLARAETETSLEPIFSLHRRARDDGPDRQIGRQVGPYLLKALIGQGGMGAVYGAEHRDGDYDRELAVKLLPPGRDSERFVRRLQEERKTLRSLIHPYIVRLLDEGTTEEGLPYLVMERVEGERIDHYCRSKRLPFGERIVLFLKVCEAVHFAHQKLVIHCDLKPANILITPEGQPRLLDFGIAQVLGRDSEEAPRARPERGFLTPHYASPEQFSGEAPTTAVDIYALGLLLYELLTGRPAHRPASDDYHAVEQVVREIPPLPPSRAVLEVRDLDTKGEETVPAAAEPPGRERSEDPRGLSRRLAGDLDSILLEALEKRPEDRYLSVEAFAEDLRRHQGHRPVLARPQTLGYRSRKFLRRNAVAVTVALLLSGLAVWLAVQALEIARQSRELERQNVEIRRERDRATEVREFLVDFLRVPDPSYSKGRALTVKEALDSAAAELREGLEGEPEVRAEILDAIGRVYTNLALRNEAEPLLNQALEIRRDVFGGDHPLVAESLHNLAYLRRRQENLVEAAKLRRRAIVIQRAAFSEGDPDLARGLNSLASILRETRELDESETLAGEALAMQVRLLGDRHLDVSDTLNTLGSVHRTRGELAEAEASYLRCIEIRRDLVGPVDIRLASALNNLALVLVEKGRLPEAVRTHREAMEMRDQIYDAGHPRRIVSLNNLSLALSLQGEHDEALALIDEAVAIQLRFRSSGRTIAALRLNRASILERRGDLRACREAIEPVLEELEVHGKPHQRAEALGIRIGCRMAESRFEDAEPVLVETLGRLSEHLGDHARQTRLARERLARLYQAVGRPDLAATLAEQGGSSG